MEKIKPLSETDPLGLILSEIEIERELGGDGCEKIHERLRAIKHVPSIKRNPILYLALDLLEQIAYERKGIRLSESGDLVINGETFSFG